MTAPTRAVRGLVYLRDGHKCLACGTRESLTFQHREASGSGGRGKKAPLLTAADGCTLCAVCNASCEASGQALALSMGWKIRRFRGDIPASQIPVFDVTDRTYYLIDEHGGREAIVWADALERLDCAGSLSRDTVQ